jgi:hypothetical protein
MGADPLSTPILMGGKRCDEKSPCLGLYLSLNLGILIFAQDESKTAGRYEKYHAHE